MKRAAGHIKSNYKNYILPVLSGILLVVLAVIAIKRLWQEENVINDQLIVEQIGQLVTIFNKIDTRCRIIDFEHEKNYIDFLTVKSFVGSMVGAMNLTFPNQWEGPYLQENPTIQDQQYLIVKTKKGYYIVPGDGVKLSNGKIMGRDIVIHYDTNIQALTHDPLGLSYEGHALAAPITMHSKLLNIAVSDQLLTIDAALTQAREQQIT